jgi:branched-chain amino acid transport system permease protein
LNLRRVAYAAASGVNCRACDISTHRQRYHLALGISLLYFTVLATAWALFSGPTHYISLATAHSLASAPIPPPSSPNFALALVLLAAARFSTLIALVVGLSTLRLSGIYFVIFSFGLAELIRQLVTGTR